MATPQVSNLARTNPRRAAMFGNLPINRARDRGRELKGGSRGRKLTDHQIADLIFFWKKMHSRQGRQNRRLEILDPNVGISTKIERYTFSVNDASGPIDTDLGPAKVFLSGQPATSVRAQRLIVNVPCPGFVYYADIKVANLSITIGAQGDAWEFNSGAQNSMLDAPTMTPALSLSFAGSYTGLAPAPYGSFEYTLAAAVQGPSTIAG